MLIKFKKYYNNIFRSARTPEENYVTNYIDALIDRAKEEGTVQADTKDDIAYKELPMFNYKNFTVQTFQIADGFICNAHIPTKVQLIRLISTKPQVKGHTFRSRPQRTERLAVQEVLKYIDAYWRLQNK